MKTPSPLRRVLLLLLIVLAGSIAAPQPAKADLIENFAWVLDQVPGVFPVSGNDIRDSKKLFVCLNKADSDTEVLNCIEQDKDTPLGQQATAAVGGVPPWFWDLIDTYIAFRTDDFWGVVGHLGKAAVCVVAQVMTGGTVDVCGLIEELVKLAKTFADAAKAVAKFIESVGTAAWEGIKSVGCSLGLGGCSKGSPPEQIAYAWVFQPEIPAGVTARKVLDPFAFNTLRQQLEADAKAKPYAKLHIQAPNVHVTLGESAVQIASGAYTEAVDLAWRKDVLQNVLPELAKKRNEYDNPQQVSIVAAKAEAEYTKNPKIPPYTWVQNLCADDFSKGFGYAHVDRWIAQFPGDAKGAGDVKTNAQWCMGSFWAKNKEKFGQHFRGYAQTHYCPAFGSGLLCQTISKYESCIGLLGSVGMSDQCGINVAEMGKDAAEKIKAHLKKSGSKLVCNIVTSGQIMNTKPADLICPRPTQGHECEEYYKKNFGTIPVKLVNCVVEETGEYKALRGKVVGAVASLNQQYPNPPNGIPFGVDLIDPLVVHAPSVDVTAYVQQKNPNFGFGPPSAKPGFDYFTFQLPHTIDGVSTPALGVDVKLSKLTQTPQLDKIQEKIAFVKPGDPDPTGKLGSKMQPMVQASPAAVAGAAKVQAPGPTKTMSGSLPPGSAPGTGAPKASLGAAAGTLSAAPGAVSVPKGPDLGGAPAPKPAQGQLPPAGGRSASQPSARAAGSAEIRSGPRVTVAGKYPVAWGQAVTISDADARRMLNGICEVAVSHDTLNSGSAATGSFGRRWVNLQNPAPVTDSYPPIPAGGSAQKTDTLLLKPGVNRLTLTLDYLNQVREGNDANNIYQLTLTVNGKCGLSTPASPPAPGRGTQTAPLPARRLPAIQQPQVPPNTTQPRLNLPRQ